MATGRGGKSVKTKLGFHLFGGYGTWKSSFCLESLKLVNEDGTPFKVLYLDAEQGSCDSYVQDYEDAGYDLRNLFIVYTQSGSEVREFIKRATNGDPFFEFDENTGEETDIVYLDADGKQFNPDMIIVDGLSVIYTATQQSLMEFSKKRATVRSAKNELTGMAKEVAINGAGMEQKDWGTLKAQGQGIILDLLASGKHFVVTSREKAETDQMKDTDGSIKSVRTGQFIPDSFKDVSYNCKTVIRMFKDDDGVIKGLIDNKDRTRIHQQNEILIEPSILDWQEAITKSKGKKEYTIRNTMDEAIAKELKTIEKEDKKYVEEFEQKANVSSTLSSPEDYKDAIKDAITKLPQTEKAKRQTAITAAGLPKAYQKLDNLDDLKKYLEIVS